MDIKEKEVDHSFVDVRSLNSDATTLYSEVSEVGNFKRGRTLIINAHGVGLIRLPCPSKELEIAITDTDENVVYMSTRAKVSSGDAILSDSNGNLVATKYFFGPGRDPVMHLMPPSKGEVGIDGERTHPVRVSWGRNKDEEQVDEPEPSFYNAEREAVRVALRE
ncbi:hypothetical protein NA57DRAFT_70870 [Rhizodiscina lignyota]|uniref:Uncharacterized protein n=1 Tax=Rhizodiscina lignyota TaxID=1504668 RepID=A0A9P4MGN2_9PEZI|nr:hypothetical protein NA57DRAFT_70870 [Rhizodiscina lignyota]